MKCNLHTHTTFSDGGMSAEEVVRAAIEGGLTHVAVTDHFETTKLPPGLAVTPRRFDAYVDEIRELGEKYSGRIEVLAGIEVDFCRRRTDFDAITGAAGPRVAWERLDLVLLEYVCDDSMGGEDLQSLMDVRACFPCPAGLAHNNVAESFTDYRPGDVIDALEATQVFVELCCSTGRNVVEPEEEDAPESGALQAEAAGVPYYRWDVPFNREFYDRVRDSQVVLSIGTDVHNTPEHVAAVDDAVEFVRERGLEGRLLPHFLLPRMTE